ncbi:hypothetical protein [Campylobacter sp. CN_NA1]|nr:hypothetical protein [Campylobacter sp. CN_NA1]
MVLVIATIFANAKSRNDKRSSVKTSEAVPYTKCVAGFLRSEA